MFMQSIKELKHIVYYSGKEDMSKLNFYLYPARKKYMDMKKEDQREFKSILQAFIRSYGFVVQVARMMDKDIQSKYIFCKYLNKTLPKEHETVIDLDDKIELEYYRLEKKFEGSIELTSEEGELNPPKGMIGKKEEEKEPLSVLVDKINQRYKTNFTNMDKVMEQITQDFLDDEEMVNLAKHNDPESFRKVYNDEFQRKAFRRYQQNTDMFEKMMSEPGYMEDFMTSMFKFIYDKLKNKGEKND